MNFAPIVIMTYSRINHLTKTIESIKKNREAKYSDLYILLDAPKDEDINLVNIVKEYVYKINGFKTVTVLERTENNRILNYVEGVKTVFRNHGKMIFLEDDNMVSENFLKFMNDGLTFYENDEKIISINGFNVPVIFPKTYSKRYYRSYYFNAWGFATWENRHHLDIELSLEGYNEIIKDTKLYSKVRRIHSGLINGLKKIAKGQLIAGDYNLTYYSIKNDVYTIRPIISLVDNIGHDGTGMNCRQSNDFSNDLSKENLIVGFSHDDKYERKIDLIYYNFFTNRGLFISRIARRAYNSVIYLLSHTIFNKGK